MTPALHYRPGQPLPWQWRDPRPTLADLQYSRDAEDHASTYLAGFRTREAAETYGRRQGWPLEPPNGPAAQVWRKAGALLAEGDAMIDAAIERAEKAPTR